MMLMYCTCHKWPSLPLTTKVGRRTNGQHYHQQQLYIANVVIEHGDFVL